MTAEIVNLRRVRKAKARSDAADMDSVNRVKFGRGGTERIVAEMNADMAARHLDGHKLAADRTMRESDGG